MHNCLSCRVEGEARSRNIPTYRRIHPHKPSPQCAASEGQTFECSPSPGMAADCRRKAPIRPAETLGKTGMTTFLQKKVILLLQSEKFVLFLNRDPPIGGRLRSNEILEDFRTTKRIAARRVVYPTPRMWFNIPTTCGRGHFCLHCSGFPPSTSFECKRPLLAFF